MNLHQKLIEIRKAVTYLKKDNKGYQFNFVSSSQAISAVRSKMDKYGVLLTPRVMSTNVREIMTRKGDVHYMTELHLQYIWTDAANPDDNITSTWYAQGIDNAEKGPGKAYTYAEKYFLLKFFNIATDKDDPDLHAQKRASKATQKNESSDLEQKPRNPSLGLASDKQRERLIEIGQSEHCPDDFKDDLRKAIKDKKLTLGRAGALISKGRIYIATASEGNHAKAK